MKKKGKNNNNNNRIIIIILSVVLAISVIFNMYFLFFNENDPAKLKEKAKTKFIGEYIYEDDEWYSVIYINDDNTIKLEATSKTEQMEPYLYEGKYEVEGNILLTSYETGYRYIYMIDNDNICIQRNDCDVDNTQYVRGKVNNIYKKNNEEKEEDDYIISDTEEENKHDTSTFNKQDLKGVLDLFDSSKTYVVYIGQDSCDACIEFLPTLKSAQIKHNFITQYLDITTIDKDSDDFKTLENKLDKDVSLILKGKLVTRNFKELFGYMPMVFIIKNKEFVSGFVGAYGKEEFEEFLNNNGM